MTRARRLMILLLAALLPALFLVSNSDAAGPNFQVPFACGTTLTAATFSGHSPTYSVDFQKTNITGVPVLASAAGTISRVADEGNTSYGKWVEINHGSGYTTRYAHLSVQSGSVGQSVSLGQKIGNAGATGGVTGPHLHYEQRLNGTVLKAVLNGVAVPYFGHTSFTSKNNCGGNPYGPTDACGTGYSVIDSQALGSSGTVYLLYSSSNGRNCVATIKHVSVGTASPVSAMLQVQGSSAITQSGSFAYYAGPVSAAAGSTCVKWGGSVGSATYTSPYEHCG